MPEHGLADDTDPAAVTEAGQPEDPRTRLPDSDVRHPLRTPEGLVVAVAVSAVMWLVLGWIIWKCL